MAARTSVILDTHAWIWAIEGRRDLLSAAALQRIEEAAREGALAVSAISVWEVAMLAVRGRVTFGMPVRQWVEASLRTPGAHLVPVDADIALESTALPDMARHKDPADRMIVATARREGMLLTCDQLLIDWAKAYGHVRFIDGRA